MTLMRRGTRGREWNVIVKDRTGSIISGVMLDFILINHLFSTEHPIMDHVVSTCQVV